MYSTSSNKPDTFAVFCNQSNFNKLMQEYFTLEAIQPTDTNFDANTSGLIRLAVPLHDWMFAYKQNHVRVEWVGSLSP